ncbi:HRDC domain-containing protein, partial [Flavicella sp.]|nr:HRDC domain-containing protein [Flavicella sp.]
TIEELSNVFGVGDGKARKFGQDFVKVIASYVKENDILRPDDLIVKGTGVKSGLKLYIIQNTDRKLSLEDIASSKGLEMPELIKEIETIVFSGTKLDISYCVDTLLDEEQQEEIMDYFMEAETDDIQEAMEEFDGDYEVEDLRLMRIKFFNEVGN